MSSEMLTQTLNEIGSIVALFALTALVTCVLLRRDKVRRDRAKRVRS